MQNSFQAKFGKPAYDWQLDVAESIVLGLDTVPIAGTGAGKTMPFMMPLLLDNIKKILVISLLKVPQQDQVMCSCTHSFWYCYESASHCKDMLSMFGARFNIPVLVLVQSFPV